MHTQQSKHKNNPRRNRIFYTSLLLELTAAIALLAFATGANIEQMALHAIQPANTAATQTQPAIALRAPAVAPPPDPTPAVPEPAHDYVIPPVQNGKVPVITHIPTTKRVAFLTIDDGIVTDPADAALMQASGVNATLFLVHRFIDGKQTYFANLAQQTGSDIENHSYDHYLMTNLSYDQQRTDICSNADAFTTWFGNRPALFRPSGGAYNDTTLRAAADCGERALIMWDAAINNGTIKFQNGSKMQPGDIVLMHFRKTFKEDLQAFVKSAQDSNLQPDLLVNWLT